MKTNRLFVLLAILPLALLPAASVSADNRDNRGDRANHEDHEDREDRSSPELSSPAAATAPPAPQGKARQNRRPGEADTGQTKPESRVPACCAAPGGPHPAAAADGKAGSMPDPARKIEVRLDTPDAGWRIAIREIHRTEERLLVVSELHRKGDMAAQVISTVSDSHKLPVEAVDDLPVHHFIAGKTWNWSNDDKNTTFIESVEDADIPPDAVRLY